ENSRRPRVENRRLRAASSRRRPGRPACSRRARHNNSRSAEHSSSRPPGAHNKRRGAPAPPEPERDYSRPEQPSTRSLRAGERILSKSEPWFHLLCAGQNAEWSYSIGRTEKGTSSFQFALHFLGDCIIANRGTISQASGTRSPGSGTRREWAAKP